MPEALFWSVSKPANLGTLRNILVVSIVFGGGAEHILNAHSEPLVNSEDRGPQINNCSSPAASLTTDLQ